MLPREVWRSPATGITIRLFDHHGEPILGVYRDGHLVDAGSGGRDGLHSGVWKVMYGAARRLVRKTRGGQA